MVLQFTPVHSGFRPTRPPQGGWPSAGPSVIAVSSAGTPTLVAGSKWGDSSGSLISGPHTKQATAAYGGGGGGGKHLGGGGPAAIGRIEAGKPVHFVIRDRIHARPDALSPDLPGAAGPSRSARSMPPAHAQPSGLATRGHAAHTEAAQAASRRAVRPAPHLPNGVEWERQAALEGC